MRGTRGIGSCARSGRIVGAWLVAVALLTGCTAGGGDTGSGRMPAAPRSGQELTAAWASGLATGVNGPIPAIVVDQFGYRPGDRKVAVFRRPSAGYDSASFLPEGYTPSARIEVVAEDSGGVVSSGPALPWQDGAVDPQSGDRAWWFDFSEVREVGSYFVRDAEQGLRSVTFDIDAAVYKPVLREALRTFLYQRAGQEKVPQTVGASWADGASHLGLGQDPQARSWLAKSDSRTERDLRGGWYDAGDYTKYTAWHSGYIVALLQTYAEHPDLIGDDFDIPESGNGVSDLLDEISWGIDWLVRMQLPDGSVLSIEQLDHVSPPSAAHGPSYYGPATTHATQRAAAALAYAGTVFADSDVPALARRSADLIGRARAAWLWSGEHPDTAFYNNDDERQPGSAGLGGGQQETDDDGRAASRLEAAVYLYEATQDARLREYVLDHVGTYLPPGSQTQWNVDRQGTLLHFAALPGVPRAVRRSIRADFRKALTTSALFLPAVLADEDPYRAPIEQFTWGSSQSKSQVGRLFALAAVHGLDNRLKSRALAAARDYVHYLHGVNPLGLVYLTNMRAAGAEHSAGTLYHEWFADGSKWDSTSSSTPGPPPGFVVGGPNPYYSPDACCADSPACGGHRASDCALSWSPPQGQPAAKSYLQFNDGWPVNSWEVTENSNGYQVSYLRLLATFA